MRGLKRRRYNEIKKLYLFIDYRYSGNTFPVLFSSRFWMGDDRAEKDMNYGQTISVAGVWDIKVNNARYDKEQRLLEVEYYSKIRSNSQAEPPTIKAILSKAVTEPIYIKIIDMPDNPNGQYIQILNMPESWYFIKLQFTAERPEGETREPITDKFGAVVKTEAYSPEDSRETRTVQIDYRMCEQTKLEVRKEVTEAKTTVPAEKETLLNETTTALIDELGQQADQIKSQLYDKNQKLSNMKKQLDSYIGQKNTLENESDSDINPGQSEIDSLEELIKKMNKAISETEAEISTLENRLKELKKKIDGGRV